MEGIRREGIHHRNSVLPSRTHRGEHERPPSQEDRDTSPPHLPARNNCWRFGRESRTESLCRKYVRGGGHVDFLILCTQSPDYFLPTTACIVQDKLGLPEHCGAIDINLGCSGYIYGLGLAKGLIESGQAERVLLLTAETYSKHINPQDHATSPLFGDGASATLVEAVDTDREGICGLVYGTDGSGFEKLIVPAGGMRHPYASTELQEHTDDFGNVRTNRNLYMDGAGIMNFALEVVPPMVDEVLAKSGLTRTEIDYYVFHQANKMMLGFLQEKCGLQDLPFWNDVTDYGNTVSSSIPIALADLLAKNGGENLRRVMLAGFGVGLSWGGCVVDLTRC